MPEEINAPLMGCALLICKGVLIQYRELFREFDKKNSAIFGTLPGDGNMYKIDGRFLRLPQENLRGFKNYKLAEVHPSMEDSLRELSQKEKEYQAYKKNVEQMLLFIKSLCSSEQDFVDLMPVELYELGTLGHLKGKRKVRLPKEIIPANLLERYESNIEYIGYLIGLGIVF